MANDLRLEKKKIFSTHHMKSGHKNKQDALQNQTI